MELYQVNFEDNKPVSAHLLPMSKSRSVKIELQGGRRTIAWITVSARNEEESIKIAYKAVEDVVGML